MMSHVKRIDFETACYTSNGEVVEGTETPVCVLFNDTVVSVEEVNKLINNGEYEYDQRLIVITPIQADFLKGKTN